jgi:hypothetical protein
MMPILNIGRAAIQPGGAFVSPVVPSFDLPHQYLAVTSSQAGALVLSRFADPGGTILIDRTTQAMSASMAASIASADSKFSQAVQVSVTNTGAAPALVSSVLAALAL